ncbi:MAG: hypothetical protein KC502_13885 [Myxococcales bacterium]|nr:hypothetical protein [Myxococcales bacterium]
MLTSLLVLGTALSGCASWEPEVVFPENYRSTYKKVASCTKSAHPAANYIETWISPDGSDAWSALAVQLAAGDTETTAVLPEGMVIVKVQYDDSKCQTLANYTAMKKLAVGAAPDVGDWNWQFVDENGECNDCASGASCAGCHKSCGPAPLMCSHPKK